VCVQDQGAAENIFTQAAGSRRRLKKWHSEELQDLRSSLQSYGSKIKEAEVCKVSEM
jgi:hypothetical protein